MARLHFLLIEENLDHAELIIRTLSKAFSKAKVHHITKYQDCLKLLKKRKFDLLLMDYYLSDGHGVHLLKDLGRLYPELPVIIITGQGDEKIATKSIKAGAEDYIVKTRESLEALPKIISRTLQKRKNHPSKKNNSVSQSPQIRSRVFKEIEQISSGIGSLYKHLNKKDSMIQKLLPDLKKLPLIEKQMLGLKSIMKKLLRSD